MKHHPFLAELLKSIKECIEEPVLPCYTSDKPLSLALQNPECYAPLPFPIAADLEKAETKYEEVKAEHEKTLEELQEIWWTLWSLHYQ